MEMAQELIFDLQGIVKRFERGREVVSIFEGMSFAVADGDFVALQGPSGSGKTTLLNLMGGIDRPNDGEIWFRDQRIDTMSQVELAQWRSEFLGFVFQSYNLLPMLSASRNERIAKRRNAAHADVPQC
jgi:putative ABC transport system ATP-binding protein